MYPSHSQFLDYHQMQGTRDLSAFLTVPKAIEFLTENNWQQVAAGCRRLAHENCARFCDLLNAKPLSPVTDEFLGQMCSIPLKTAQPEKLQRLLFEIYRIEIPVMRQDDKVFIRYSVQAFNEQKDLDALYNALTKIIAETDLIEI
jgi:isopenicillin-N epimerase